MRFLSAEAEPDLASPMLRIFSPEAPEPSEEETRIIPTPFQEKFLRRMRRKTDAQLLAAVTTFVDGVPLLDTDDLELLLQEFGPENCDCERIYLPCDCGWVSIFHDKWVAHDDKKFGEWRPNDTETGKFRPTVCPECGSAPEFMACKHLKSFYLSAHVLEAIHKRLSKEPPPPRFASSALSQDSRATLLALRHDAGLGLWNPDDLIYRATDWVEEDADGDLINYDRIGREAYTLDNGHREAGGLAINRNDLEALQAKRRLKEAA